jgi:hypothetical protein
MKNYTIQMESIEYKLKIIQFKWKITQFKWRIIKCKWKRSNIATLMYSFCFCVKELCSHDCQKLVCILVVFVWRFLVARFKVKQLHSNRKRKASSSEP